MTLLHLTRTDSVDDVVAALDRDGGVIIDDAMQPGQLAQTRAELAPWIERTADGIDEFVGVKTRRIGALVARSPSCAQLVIDPLVNRVAAQFLRQFCERHQLNLTMGVSIGPGEKGQVLHRDRTLWGYPLPFEIETHLSTIWATTEFTAANGATRIVPGSHKWDEERVPDPGEVVAAEMRAGSVLLYTGKVIHGGGPNSTQERRLGVIIQYIVGWLRQEENQYLSCPPEIAATLSPELRALIGYSKGRYSLGFFSSPGRPGEGHELASPEEIFGGPPEIFEKSAGLGVDAN